MMAERRIILLNPLGVTGVLSQMRWDGLLLQIYSTGPLDILVAGGPPSA